MSNDDLKVGRARFDPYHDAGLLPNRAGETMRVRRESARLPEQITDALALPDGKYARFLGPFVRMMNAELHANAGKGDRQGWLSMSSDQAMLEIYYHAAKLQKAVRDGDAALIREHSADVANGAMMLLDLCVGLPDPEGGEDV